ncbi:MAG TPA: tRNA uridine-5-carboxymethylaminomethyl(34) synthesis GTPase MnmE [Myxococcota bacterium]|nr:tRNA uridine-5-carboxymethylaminomethyl(34) synthesis GTPase MnmE [Myxococcota bacterium]HOS62935.1 tRNA uridine-5-carboxymethylaminomethyl(34) synthesis GTPase MnmE [Myxococcota bacterium]HPL25521.1 tRNA uridine-5-carboxymethylaminomethyl(34) synthesis GTPase MnmE [Myxococcota bacterium]
MVSSDVIVALATAPGRGALGIVRLSGAGCHSLAMRLCPGLREVPMARLLTRVHIVDPGSGRKLDDATVVFFNHAASFTGEESVEFICHGGALVLDGVIKACTLAGARHALPGEFTRRAVASGRLDLVQAEAVALLTDASNEQTIDVALDALGGAQSEKIANLRGFLLDILANWEATLDFIEDDNVVVDVEEALALLDQAISTMEQGIAAAQASRPAIEGVKVALVGAPNAGKSSLFNALLEQDRAIVRPEAGTTRDVISERLVLSGVAIELLDTAGLRSADGVEGEGVARAIAAAQQADIRVLVVDGAGLAGVEAFGGINPDLVVYSKADLWGGDRDGGRDRDGNMDRDGVVCSCVDGTGLGELRKRLSALIDQVTRTGFRTDLLVVGQRQLTALFAALHRVRAAKAALSSNMPLDLAAIDLRAAIDHLGEISGSSVSEEIMDRVFSRFCIGK